MDLQEMWGLGKGGGVPWPVARLPASQEELVISSRKTIKNSI
jgi:hypothetical protein